MTSDFDGILTLGEAESAITYRRKNAAEIQLNAIVLEADPVGVLDEAGPRPIAALISKSDLAEVNPGREFLVYSGRTYRVKEITSETTAWWELYCHAAG